MISWKRTLRTTSSERFLAQREGKDVAAVDLHYLANGTIAGTVILLKDAGWNESDVPALLGSLDEDFLPDVDLDQPVQPRGYRLLSRIPRMSEALAHNVVDRFGSLAKVLRCTTADLTGVPGVDEDRARVIKDALGRLAETSILEQYG